MGAVTVTRIAPALSEKDLKDWFRQELSDMGRESGTGPYSGNWCTNQGLRIHPRAVASDKDAEALCEQQCDKWGSVLAVRVGDFAKSFPETKADKALVDKLQELSKAVDLFDWNVLDRSQKAKSKTRKCSHCESSINVHKMDKPTLKEYESAGHDYMHIPSVFWMRGRRHLSLFRSLTDCPVCGHNLLLTDTDKKALSSLVSRRDEAQRKLATAKAAYEAKQKNATNRPHWYVSALCGS